MFDHYKHEVIKTSKGIFLIDIANIPGYGWEAAYVPFDEKEFLKNWDAPEYTFDDVKKWGEDFRGFDPMGWIIASEYTKTPTAAEKKMMKVLR